ncbi:MAG: tetratricopeptide repeat protein [Microthrixaceae bacterium]
MQPPTPSFTARALAEMEHSGELHRSDHASLVFADVSGFTPLTERFARLGREGSEKLTELLNELFGPTLDAALQRGGDLLSFGGDALLIQFDRGDHAADAAAAAEEMRRCFLAAARRSKVKVTMSIGVATGGVHLHRVGSTTRVLVAHGSAVRTVLELESAASGGEILIGAAPRAAGGPTGPSSAPPPPVPSTARDAYALLDPYVATALRSGDGTEHRHSVVAFVRYDIDPEASPSQVDDLVRPLFDVIEAACAASQVTILNSDVEADGGKVTLTAGVPFTTGDDADRMLEAALRIVADADSALGVRIGVNEGQVFAGPVGSSNRMSYTIMGDDVNLAARVAGQARRATVLATDAVLDRARQAFVTTPIDPFRVKGKTIEVSAAEVERVSAAARRRASSGSFHGRSAELATLTALLPETGPGDRTAPGAVAEIVAEPGLGKSRLVGELVARAEVGTHTIEAGRYLAGAPYGAVSHSLRQWLGVDAATADAIDERLGAVISGVAPHLVPWRPFLAIPAGVELPDTPATAGVAPAFRRRRIHQVTAEFLPLLLAGARLLVVEDAHWLDDATGELLDAVIPELTAAGWLVVVTRRPETTGWSPASVSMRLDLEPLGFDDATGLAHEIASSSPLSDHVVRRVVARSNGNPLFVEQLVRAVSDGTRVDDLPDRVEVLIEARIDRLAPAVRTTLRSAAVLGARFDSALLEDLEPGSTTHLADLDEFLILDDDQVRFRHALFRDTAYLALPARQRRSMHARAARAVEHRYRESLDDVVELLAEHWDDAAEPAWAWPYLRAAADRARADHAAFEASRFLERAIRCAGRVPGVDASEVAVIEEQLGELYDVLGRFGDAERSFRQARRRTSDPSDAARLLGLEARVARSMLSLSTAVRRYRRALSVVPADEHQGRSALLVGLSSVLERQGRHRAKLPLLHEAIDAAERSGDRRSSAHAHLLLGNTYGDLGQPEAVEHLATALSLFDAAGDIWGVASSRNNLGVEAYYAGDWDEALGHYLAASEGYRRLGDETNEAMTLNNVGEIHSDQGRWDEAEVELREARRMWQASGFALGVGIASSNLGRLAARQGRAGDADAEFQLARNTFQSISARGRLLELDARVASAAAGTDEFERALDLARRTLRAGEELQPTVQCELHRTAAIALARTGRPGDAAESLECARRLARESGAVYEIAACELAARSLGLPFESPTDTLHRLGVVNPGR